MTNNDPPPLDSRFYPLAGCPHTDRPTHSPFIHTLLDTIRTPRSAPPPLIHLRHQRLGLLDPEGVLAAVLLQPRGEAVQHSRARVLVR
eukprot:1226957-Rhodomonas_salina.2